MLFLIAVLVGVVVGYVRGGRLGNLSQFGLRFVWLVAVALAIQLLVFPLFSERPIIPFGTTAFHAISYVLVFAFLFINLRIWPLVVIGVGAILNVLAIAFNSGRMPVSMTALERTGAVTMIQFLSESPVYGNVVKMSETTRLNVLGDWLYLPVWSPITAAFSLGDVVIILGLIALIVKGMKRHG